MKLSTIYRRAAALIALIARATRAEQEAELKRQLAQGRRDALEEAARHVGSLPRWCYCDDGGQGGCDHDQAIDYVVDSIRALMGSKDGQT